MADNDAEQRMPTSMKFREPLLLRYLVKTLESLTEADPALVANYVVALLKNNKPEEELQKICVTQLHEFLGDNTKSFVTKLFHALEDSTILATVDDIEGRNPVDTTTTTIVPGDSADLSSSLQNERLPSAIVSAFAEHDEQEGSNDEDDDRNPKHTRRIADSPSFTQGEDVRGIGNKRARPVSNDQSILESEKEISKQCRDSTLLHTDREGSRKYHKIRHGSAFSSRSIVDGDHKRGSQIMYNEAVAPGFDSVNGPIHLPRGQGRGVNTGPWGLHDSRFPSYETLDFPSAVPLRSGVTNLYPGRAIINHAKTTNPPWVPFASLPGMPNGGLEQPRLLYTGLQGHGLSLNSTIGIGMGIGHPRCRDFEERGFCLRGDMCPMEHGANRIVVDDFQSLSKLNLSVPIPSRRLMGMGTGTGGGPSTAVISISAGSAKKNSYDKNIGYGDSVHLNTSPTGTVGMDPDLYDPDQPSLNNGHPEASSLLRKLPSLRKGEDEHLSDCNPPDRPSHGISDIGVNIRPQRCVTSAGISQNKVSSVWDRIGPREPEEGSSGGVLQRGKQTNKELYDGQHSYSNGEKRGIETDSDEHSESKGTGIYMQDRKARGTGTYGVWADTGSDSSKHPESVGHVTHRNVVQRSRQGNQKAQRTLFVSCIPLQNNKAELLLSHFKKFGEVLGISIPPNTGRAFVQYSSRKEAEVALTSTDAVMGNRFIKLAWANWDSTMELEKTSATLASSGKTSNAMAVAIPVSPMPKQNISNSALPFSPRVSTSEAINADTRSVKLMPTNDSRSSIISAVVHKQETLESLKLLRQKQEMLAQKREDFRRHLEKLAKQGIGTRVDLSDKNPAAKDLSDKNPAAKRQKTEEAVTDSNNPYSVNLELDPGPVKGVSKHISEGVLKQISGSRSLSPAVIPHPLPKISKLSLVSPSGPLSGPRFSPNRFKLDNRPTALRILPPLPHGLLDIIALKEHFALFGDLSAVEVEDAKNQCDEASEISETCVIRVTYVTRRAAERAFIEGRFWQGKNLQLAWVMASNTINHESGKNTAYQNSKGDSTKGDLIEMDTVGGQTVTMDDPTNTDMNVAENCSTESGQNVTALV